MGKQLREEVLVTRGSKIGMGGAIALPPWTDPTVVELLVDGTSEQQIIDLVGPPWRQVPAERGELWLWEMRIFESHVVLAINVVGGLQLGAAVAEWRTIPDFILHHGWLEREPERDVARIVDVLGSPTRWEIATPRSTMIWEAALQLGGGRGSWGYTPDVYLHSLRVEVVGDRLDSVGPIESRIIQDWPRSAVQHAAAAGGAPPRS